MACLLCQSQPIYELSPIGGEREGDPQPSTVIHRPSSLNQEPSAPLHKLAIVDDDAGYQQQGDERR